MSFTKKYNKNDKGSDYQSDSAEHDRNGKGTALGGLITGLVILCAGIYIILQNTIISTHFSLMSILGFDPPFGLVLLPLLIGIGVLFFNSKSILGWIILIFGIISIILGILMSLRIYFKPVTLYQGLLMFGMTAAGAGLILKAFLGKS